MRLACENGNLDVVKLLLTDERVDASPAVHLASVDGDLPFLTQLMATDALTLR
jgi:hypothetical protein